MKVLLGVVSFLLITSVSHAGWHLGKVKSIAIGYDGKTTTFVIDGWVRNDCTCYPDWTGSMCLDSTRDTLKIEQAMLLSAKARNKEIHANINEETCRVTSLEEP